MKWWQKYGIIVSALYATAEVLSLLSSGATLIISRLPIAYNFVVSTPYLSPSLTFLLGIIFGAYAVSSYNPEPRIVAPREIKGCIEKDDVHWRISAERRDEKITRFNVRSNPYCPKCKTKMEKTQDEPVGLPQPRKFWQCMECDNMESRTLNVHSEVEEIARKHVERIIETRGEEFSLDVLTNEIYERTDETKPTGKDIWRLYVDRMDDEDYITTDCFHDSG